MWLLDSFVCISDDIARMFACFYYYSDPGRLYILSAHCQVPGGRFEPIMQKTACSLFKNSIADKIQTGSNLRFKKRTRYGVHVNDVTF